MYNINFCKNTRKNFARDFRVAAVEVKKEMVKKAKDEAQRALERLKSQQRVASTPVIV